MTDIAELERRISAALDRIRKGVDQMGASHVAEAPGNQDDAPSPDSGDSAWKTARIAQLEAQIADEKSVTAQLEERIRVLKDRQDGQATQLAGQNEQVRDRLVQCEAEIEALRQTNADLRELTQKLRTAMEQGLANPELVNRALQAELDALRAVRAADAAELDAVIGELKPLIEEAN
ncbi:MAG: hypothetical protein EBT13_17255 [Rhodobacteraceae bacterium]|nr:hypothetical protein [Paracoccaceae bacterium]